MLFLCLEQPLPSPPGSGSMSWLALILLSLSKAPPCTFRPTRLIPLPFLCHGECYKHSSHLCLLRLGHAYCPPLSLHWASESHMGEKWGPWGDHTGLGARQTSGQVLAPSLRNSVTWVSVTWWSLQAWASLSVRQIYSVATSGCFSESLLR